MSADPVFAAQYRGVREGVAFAELGHVFALRWAGAGATAALGRLSTGDVRMREGRLRQSLFLDDAGRPIADVHVCRDEGGWLLLVEALNPESVVARVAAAAGPDLVDLRSTHRLMLLTGPWCWQLLSEIVGAEVAVLPSGTFFHFEDWIGLRAGKTGEFGYVLLAPSTSADRLRARIESIGERFDLCHVGLDVLDHCALEGNFFNLRREGQFGASPIELQLQWRMQRTRAFTGASALAEELRTGPARRITAVASDGPLAVGDPVHYHGERIGMVVNAGFSPARGDWIGTALLPTALAHPGIDRFTVAHDGSDGPIRTLTPPFIQPRSLFVVTQAQRYEHRNQYQFPPFV